MYINISTIEVLNLKCQGDAVKIIISPLLNKISKISILSFISPLKKYQK